MSGGIDSSVSAMLLQEQGYDVVGITFQFSGTNEQNHHFLNDAKELAAEIGIKHITVDLRDEFSNVIIKYFVDEYSKGHTPFPCAYCNPNLKFKYLEEFAEKEDCDFIATGHYVKMGLHKGEKYLFQGDDPWKDQTFFLWGLNRKLVNKLIFPLGEFNKSEIRKLAHEKGFVSLAKKKDSLGICFIEGNNYRSFLVKEGIKSIPGNFVNQNGEVLGQHSGIINYTIGQRRGLGIHLNFPVWVAEIRPDANEIVLAKYENLYRSKIIIKNYYLLDKEIINGSMDLLVKVRYRLQETPCRLHILDETRLEVELLEPEAMIAPGQTAVLFHGERLVGGGFIESSE